MHKAFAAAGLIGLTASAQGAFVSFASDSGTGHTGWTFLGDGAAVQNAAPTPVFDLLIDDNNGLLAPLSISAPFSFDTTLVFRGSVPSAGGVTYVYDITGSFSIGQLSTTGLLLGSMTVLGGNFGGTNYWGSTATIQFNQQFGSIQYTWSGPGNPAYDLPSGASSGPDDGAFSLTVLHPSNPNIVTPFAGYFGVPYMGVPLGGDFLPATAWESEGSFSGQLHIPSPGAVALMGLGGLLALRRKR